MTITIPDELAAVLRADADRLRTAPETLALNRLRRASTPRDQRGRFADGTPSTRNEHRGAVASAPGEDWYKPTYIVDGEEATEEEFYNGLTPEDKASVATSFREYHEAERRGEPMIGIPGEVAVARRQQHLAERRAQHAGNP